MAPGGISPAASFGPRNEAGVGPAPHHGGTSQHPRPWIWTACNPLPGTESGTPLSFKRLIRKEVTDEKNHSPELNHGQRQTVKTLTTHSTQAGDQLPSNENQTNK